MMGHVVYGPCPLVHVKDSKKWQAGFQEGICQVLRHKWSSRVVSFARWVKDIPHALPSE